MRIFLVSLCIPATLLWAVQPDPLPLPTNPPDPAVREVFRRAAERYNSIDCLEARMLCREVHQGKQNAEELLRVRFRRAPYSLSMKWIAGTDVGREVLYVHGRHDNKIHLMPIKKDTAPLPAFRMAFAPDDPLIKSRFRHDIREASIGEPIRWIAKALEAEDRGDVRLKSLGRVERPEYPNALDGIVEVIPPRVEELLPRGGKRTTYFDPNPSAVWSGLPVVVITHDELGREVEYYRYDRFLMPITLDDSDFEPARLGMKT